MSAHYDPAEEAKLVQLYARAAVEAREVFGQMAVAQQAAIAAGEKRDRYLEALVKYRQRSESPQPQPDIIGAMRAEAAKADQEAAAEPTAGSGSLLDSFSGGEVDRQTFFG